MRHVGYNLLPRLKWDELLWRSISTSKVDLRRCRLHPNWISRMEHELGGISWCGWPFKFGSFCLVLLGWDYHHLLWWSPRGKPSMCSIYPQRRVVFVGCIPWPYGYSRLKHLARPRTICRRIEWIAANDKLHTSISWHHFFEQGI